MKELTSIEKIKNYAARHGYEFMSNSEYENHHLYPNDPVLNTKYCVSKVKIKNTDFYLCQHDYFSTQMGMNNTYCGLFRNNNHNIEFQIMIKGWIDTLSFHKHEKTGSSFIDENLVIHSPENLLDRYINVDMAEEFIALSKEINPVKLISAESYINYVPELASGHILGIVTNKWLTEDHELDIFIEKGIKILTIK
jgi:hypothetical protein